MSYRFTKMVANDRLHIIMLCQGTTPQGKPYYAYLRMKPEQAEKLEAAEQGSEIKLNDYGEVLCFGYDKEPPEDIKRKYASSH